jgi:hypothetical protein
MIDAIHNWLSSKEFAQIAGSRFRPIENKFLRGEPLFIQRSRAQVFYLKDDSARDWLLKKFFPRSLPDSAHLKAIQSLIPAISGFEAGHKRLVVSEKFVSNSDSLNSELLSWLENTILMTRTPGTAWAAFSDGARSGVLNLPNDLRLLLCRNLSEKVSILEENNLAHRNLSRTSVFIAEDWTIHIIDWDGLFHPTLAIPPNADCGTCGYIAPFAQKSRRVDPFLTWRPQSDRFSLAIQNSEFLALGPDSPIAGDGEMFDQDEVYQRKGDSLNQIHNHLRNSFPGAAILLEKALNARGFDECPSPADWIEFCTGGRQSADGVGPSIDFYSCFISYNQQDKDFAQRLYSRLRDAGLRVWFAPENIRGGRKLLPQVDLAIEMHDRLLLVLSDSSLRSSWVRFELRKAIEFERKSGRRKLFPIRLVDYETLLEWSCIEPQTADDLADEVRSFFIPDFSNWKSYDDFERAFARLLNDLKTDT